MSDIYLQITETPTVVTLSAPVISGALSSTVTVSNTVTVALDSNSLSALENVTVTVGAAVSISNFPVTQAVSLASVPTHGVTLASTTVTVSSLPAISGTVTANAGSGFPAVIYSGILQYIDAEGSIPVYIDSLPAGTNRIGVVTIGGGTVTIGAGTAQIGSVTASISGTVPVSGTFWQATQPVSLASVPAHAVTLTSTTVTVSSLPALAAGTAQIGSVTASISGTVPVSGTFYQATQPVSLATVPTHGVTLASTTVTVSSLPGISGTVTANFIKPTWTNYSGTVATANTAVTVITATTRSYLLAQVTTGQMFLNIGATATTLNSVYFSAGQGFAWETSVPQGIVSIISAVTGTNYVLKEG